MRCLIKVSQWFLTRNSIVRYACGRSLIKPSLSYHASKFPLFAELFALLAEFLWIVVSNYQGLELNTRVRNWWNFNAKIRICIGNVFLSFDIYKNIYYIYCISLVSVLFLFTRNISGNMEVVSWKMSICWWETASYYFFFVGEGTFSSKV